MNFKSFIKNAFMALALIAIGGYQTVAAQQKLVTYTLSGGETNPDGTTNPIILSPKGDLPDGVTVGDVTGIKYASGDEYYVEKTGKSALAALNNFKYYVGGITWVRWVNTVGTSLGQTRIITYDKDNNGEYKSEGSSTFNLNIVKTAVTSGNFIEIKDGFSHKGIQNFAITVNKGEPIKLNAFNVTYYEPEIKFADNTPKSLLVGESVNLSDYYSVDYQGAFDFSTVVFSANDHNTISLNSTTGEVIAKKPGKAIITLTLTDPSCGKVIKTTTTIIVPDLIKSGDTKHYRCHDSDDQSDDNHGSFDLSEITVDNLKSISTTPNYTFEYVHDRHANPDGGYYSFGQLTSTSSKRIRVGFQTLKKTINIPKYSSLYYKYDFLIEANDGTTTNGAELFWTENETDFDNMSLNTSGTSTASNSYSLCRAISSGESSASAKYTKEGTVTTEQDSKDFTYYLGLMSFVKWHNFTNNVQTSTFWKHTNLETWKYTASITFHSNDGNDDTSTQGYDVIGYKEKNEYVILNCGKTWTRPGYTLTGWNTKADGKGESYKLNGEFYPYDQLNKCGKGPVDLFAVWTPEVYEVTLHHEDGKGTEEQIQVYYGNPMPGKDDVPAPIREGYKFHGYWTCKDNTSNGVYSNNGGIQYYNEDMESARNWDKTSNGDLYAQWVPYKYTITFDAGEGTIMAGATTNYVNDEGVWESRSLEEDSKTMSIRVITDLTAGCNIWNGQVVAPEEELTFDGWYTEANGGGTKVYDVDFQAIKGTAYWSNDNKWIGTSDITLYANYVNDETLKSITFDANGGMIAAGTYYINFNNTTNSQVQKITESDEKTLTINVKEGNNAGSTFWGAGMKKRPGYTFTGWYTGKTDGVQVYNIYFSAVDGDYWKSGVWKGTTNLILYAHYTPNFTIDKDVITLNSGCSADADDIAGVIDEAYTVNEEKIVTNTFDCRAGSVSGTGEQVMTAIQNGIAANKVSANALIYFTNSKGPYINDANYPNSILGEYCENLKVTDKVEMKIPWAFMAERVSYTRVGSSAATSSVWGTICLPYAVKGNSDIRYYKLNKVNDDCMQFTPYSNETEIPANTPLVYKRQTGQGGDITISRTRSEDTNWNKLSIPCDGDFVGVDNSFDGWSFVGTRKEVILCGDGYNISKLPAGAQKVKYDNIYYFKQDVFTQVNHNGGVKVPSYRAYFIEGDLEYSEESQSAKSSAKAYRIVVLDDDDFATDITDALNGNCNGDGKIYDLAGRRVKTPLNGQIYIVNGKKILY